MLKDDFRSSSFAPLGETLTVSGISLLTLGSRFNSMWNCKVCEAVIEAVIEDDSWDNCWKCSASKNLLESEVEERRNHLEKSMSCLRCDSEMKYAGTKRFHEGTRLGVLGI